MKKNIDEQHRNYMNPWSVIRGVYLTCVTYRGDIDEPSSDPMGHEAQRRLHEIGVLVDELLSMHYTPEELAVWVEE